MSEIKYTIGMAVYDDWEGVFFTVQSLLMHHLKGRQDVELIVVDNNPDSNSGKCVKDYIQKINGALQATYIPYTHRRSTAIRNVVFERAQGEYVLCIDCHVLLEEGAIDAFFQHYEENPDCDALIHGPMAVDSRHTATCKMIPEWGGYMFGRWGDQVPLENLPDEKFEIPGHGMGLFGSKRSTWLGFSPKFVGFGGEEYYIHEKYRQHGRKIYCLPKLIWVHRFVRDKGIPYPNLLEERLRNYFIGWNELNLSTDGVRKEFSNHSAFNQDTMDKLEEESLKELEQISPNDIHIVTVPRTGTTRLNKTLGLPFTSGIKRFHLDDNQFDQLCKIAVVRNPYDRFISLVNVALMEESVFYNKQNPHPDHKLLKGKSLDEICDLLEHARIVSGQFWKQMDFIENVDNIDVVLRYETLDEDWKNLMENGYDGKQFSSEVPRKLEEFDKSTHFFKPEQLTAKMKEQIYNYFIRDFEGLGYSK